MAIVNPKNSSNIRDLWSESPWEAPSKEGISIDSAFVGEGLELSRDPLSYMPDVDSVVSSEIEHKLKMCVAKRPMHIWDPTDAKTIAGSLVGAEVSDVENFVKFLERSEGIPSEDKLIRGVFTALASTTDGLDAAGFILSEMEDPAQAIRILYRLAQKDPVAAARIRNSFEYFAQTAGMDMEELGETMNEEYPQGCSEGQSVKCLNQDLFLAYSDATAMASARFFIEGSEGYLDNRDLILHTFAEYNRSANAGERIELEGDLKAISCDPAASPWQISYGKDGIVAGIDYYNRGVRVENCYSDWDRKSAMRGRMRIPTDDLWVMKDLGFVLADKLAEVLAERGTPRRMEDWGDIMPWVSAVTDSAMQIIDDDKLFASLERKYAVFLGGGNIPGTLGRVIIELDNGMELSVFISKEDISVGISRMIYGLDFDVTAETDVKTMDTKITQVRALERKTSDGVKWYPSQNYLELRHNFDEFSVPFYREPAGTSLKDFLFDNFQFYDKAYKDIEKTYSGYRVGAFLSNRKSLDEVMWVLNASPEVVVKDLDERYPFNW